MDLSKLQKSANTGWNTYYNENLLSHVLLPWGFSINLSFRKRSSGDVFRSLLVSREAPVRVDVRSFDGSYTCLHIRHGNVPLKIESSSKDGEELIVVTPEGYYSSDEQLIVETAFLWGRDGTLTKDKGMTGAICPDGTEIKLYTNTAPRNYYLPELTTPYMVFDMNSPVVISTFPCATERACKLMGELHAGLLESAKKYGKYADSFLAMQSCLGWNTVYDPQKDRVCTPVTRNWNKGKPLNIFCWDTFFGAMMLSLEDTELSYLNIKAILDEMTPEGMIPNSLGTNHSQPLVGCMTVEQIYLRNKDKELIREIYPSLLHWNTWYYENRMTEKGYMCWGTGSYGKGKETLFGAKCESGMDNSPLFDDGVYDEESGLCLIADVGLTGLFVKDCLALIYFAKELGISDDIPELEHRLARAEKGLAALWNEEDGIYENLDLVTGEFCRRLSPFNFLCLHSPSVSEDQKRSIAAHLLNEEEFWGEYVLPSISRNDPAFSEQQYWRGRIWAPLNFMVFQALKDAGLYKEAKMLAEKGEKMLMFTWEEERRIYENYGATDGLGNSARQSDSFYHWGALLAYMAIDAESFPKEDLT